MAGGRVANAAQKRLDGGVAKIQMRCEKRTKGNTILAISLDAP